MGLRGLASCVYRVQQKRPLIAFLQHFKFQLFQHQKMFKTALRSFSSTASRSDFARMQLYGCIGKIVARESKDNVPFLTYSLAVNKVLGGAEKVRSTDWYNISVFDEKHVSFFENHLGPGAVLIVDADVTQKQLADENGENRQIFTTLKQKKFEVVRFPKKTEEVEEESL